MRATIIALSLALSATEAFVRAPSALTRSRCSVKVNLETASRSGPAVDNDAAAESVSGVLGGTKERWAKATKQVATVGPSSNTYEALERLFLAGVDVFRLNFSHGSHEEKMNLVGIIRELERNHGKSIGILADLQGPKHRVGLFHEGEKVSLKKGQHYRFDLDEESLGSDTRVSLPHADVIAALEVGHRVLLDDGKLVVEVRSKSEGAKPSETFVECEVMNDASISSRKGFNLPDTLVESSPITKKDREDLEFIVKEELEVDWVALSFVQTPQDIIELRDLTNKFSEESSPGKGHKLKFMAKLEKPSAVNSHLEGIVSVCDGIMVARGDLGVEMVVESVPITQKRIISMCHLYGKPVIVATQMLESMIESPTPTRAEVSDVATAVFDGADAVMLSAESAAGKYPVEAVTTQQKIISSVEADRSFREQMDRRNRLLSRTFTTTDAITDASGKIASQISAKAIVVFTQGGTTVLRASRDRHSVPVIAVTSEAETARYLTLAWGVDTVLLDDADMAHDDFDDLLERVLVSLREKGVVSEPNDLVLVTAGFPFGVPGAVNNLRVLCNAGPRSWDKSLVHGH